LFDRAQKFNPSNRCARIRRLSAVDVEQFTRQTTGKIEVGRMRRPMKISRTQIGASVPSGKKS
jgi:hypothetical protein